MAMTTGRKKWVKRTTGIDTSAPDPSDSGKKDCVDGK
jgi:hypothetical protein